MGRNVLKRDVSHGSEVVGVGPEVMHIVQMTSFDPWALCEVKEEVSRLVEGIELSEESASDM